MRSKTAYRIVVNSLDAIKGTQNDGFFKINCQRNNVLSTKTQYQFAIEYFVTDTQIGFDESISVVLINIPTLTQINSYNTFTQSTNPNVLMLTENSYSTTIQHNSIGHQLSSIDFMTSSILEIQFTDTNNNVLDAMGAWSMSLVIWEVEEV